ncbi:hypothetical protein V8C37DRAFT_383610 [Trichoderma ceciliae]
MKIEKQHFLLIYLFVIYYFILFWFIFGLCYLLLQGCFLSLSLSLSFFFLWERDRFGRWSRKAEQLSENGRANTGIME